MPFTIVGELEGEPQMRCLLFIFESLFFCQREFATRCLYSFNYALLLFFFFQLAKCPRVR